MAGRRVTLCVAIAVALTAAGYGGYRYRRAFIRSFFAVGPGGGPPPALPRAGAADPALPAVPRTRVVLLDGLDAETARSLPSYSAVCDAGLDVTVDVGFPTVSLPVQHALWTGLAQQQTGMLFIIHQQPPPDDGIPAQVPGSVAVADTHPEILGSLGFSTAEVPEQPEAFEPAATAIVTGDARLAFVHVVSIDAAGHAHGRASEAYRAAARDADALLGRLRAADAARPDASTRWFVLSDHGHRDGGGHGGAEASIRRVRACIAGALPDALRRAGGGGGRVIHIVDVARAIADSTGAQLPAHSAARPLSAALAAPLADDPGLPAPAALAWLIAALALVAAAAATAWAAGRRLLTLPWWWPIAYVSVVLIEQAPTLSVPMVYRPMGQTIYTAALPGLCALAVLATLALRWLSPARVVVAQLAIPVAAIVAALALAGVGTGHPPLMPQWTARASVFLVIGFTGAAVVALAVLASAFRRASDRTTPSETSGTGS